MGDRECFPMSEHEECEEGRQSSSPSPSRRQSLFSFLSMSMRRNVAGCCTHRKSWQTGAFREDQGRMCWMPLFIYWPKDSPTPSTQNESLSSGKLDSWTLEGSWTLDSRGQCNSAQCRPNDQFDTKSKRRRNQASLLIK